MRIETPQILWHNGADNDNGKNAPLYSLSLLSLQDNVHVLATAGNTSEVHLWKMQGFDSAAAAGSKRILQQSKTNSISHALSLVRHDLSVNVVKFSPDGLHLATAGDGGSILIWSCSEKRDWARVEKEKDLSIKIVSACSQGICDLQWSSDSNSMVVGTIDHSVLVYERSSDGKNWNCSYRNARDHTAYVQGVAYDPHGLYVASMGSDRTVRIYQRKVKKNKKKKNSKATTALVAQDSLNNSTAASANHRPSFTDKLELTRTKTLKYRQVPAVATDAASSALTPTTKQYLFADESTVESFFRRLAWTQDGNFLVTPAALWHANTDDISENKAQPSFATYLFARHKFDVPYKVLPGLEKPSVAIRPNPVLFTLPDKENKENSLDYRSVFCVLTLDTVLIYDTHHTSPLCIARGLHYSGLTDATWSADGHHLLVSSTDGYISILSFDKGELGQVHVDPNATAVVDNVKEQPEINAVVTASRLVDPTLTMIPPCEPGQAATLLAPPAKRARKSRITPTLMTHKRVLAEDSLVESAVHKLKIDEQPKKKKRITPQLVSVAP